MTASSRFRCRPWRPSRLKKRVLTLSFKMLLTYLSVTMSVSSQDFHEEPADPMEPCYLTNNRASESLTISESTPVGTVVGEIMVNGDSSANGNIELSIRMTHHGSTDPSSSRHPPRYSNGYSSSSSPPPPPPSSRLAYIGATTSKHASTGNGDDESIKLRASSASPKLARDLSNLIDSMPPLTIHHETKRLILAKKLDRENLDKYISTNVYQSGSGASLSQGSSSSSAPLTVLIKCQLRNNRTKSLAQRSANSNSTVKSTNDTLRSTGQQLVDTSNRLGNIDQTNLSDSSSGSKFGQNTIIIPIHIIVTDENDNWPMFINSPYIIDLNESAPIGSLLAGNEIMAVDGDQQGPLSTIEYSIVAGSIWSESFAFLNPLDARSLIVKDNRMLDYEGQSKISLKVMARDQGDPPNWSITSLYINLIDDDDLGPVFGEDKYYGLIKDNRPGEIVELLPRRLTVRDGDKSINSPIAYSFHLKTDHSIHFELDPDLGKLSLKKTLGDEFLQTGAQYCLLVRATQVDNPARWTLTMVNIRHQRPVGQFGGLLAAERQHGLPTGNELSNLSELKFSHSNFTVEVSEAAAPGFTVLSLKATLSGKQSQMAAGLSSQLTYHLLDNERGFFKIDPNSGRLTLNRSLDFELYQYHSVRVLATYEQQNPQSNGETSESIGSGFPRLNCDMARVNIIVINHNEFKPQFSHEQYNFQLGISDLIANFDLPKVSDESQPNGQQISERRKGELDGQNLHLADDSADDQLGWRSMQLGQIYCADSDFGSKVSLKLAPSSKAHLFQLTQDGKLYLPLVNMTNYAQQSIHLQHSLMRRSETVPKTINNQFYPSRMAGGSHLGRRSDQLLEPPDRDYLNYLLSEFSNLGRLKLKVVAIDDGQPQSLQSSSVIVITVISIDNFILHRSPPLPATTNNPNLPNQDDGQTVDNPKFDNDLSSSSSASSTSSLPGIGSLGNTTNDLTTNLDSQATSINQVMMIPSNGGRDFLQVNSDIISNLVSRLSLGGSSRNSEKNSSDSQKDLIDEMGSKPTQTQILDGSSTAQLSTDAVQPPSLLLVDEEGAKFMARLAAMEVYNQQVQVGNRNRLENSETSKRHLKQNESKNQSPWSQVKSWFGLRSLDEQQQTKLNGHTWWLYWANLSTIITLHLVAVVIIISLVVKMRSLLRNRRHQGGDLLSGSSILPTSVADLFRNSKTLDVGSSNSVLKIMAQQEQNLSPRFGNEGGGYPGGSGSSDTSTDSDLAFVGRHNKSGGSYVNQPNSNQSSDSDQSNSSSNNYQPVVRGVVVKAMSNSGNQKQGQRQQIVTDDNRASSATSQQTPQNFFGQLKVSLNKIFEPTGNDKSQIASDIGIKSLEGVETMESDGAYKLVGTNILEFRPQTTESPPVQMHSLTKHSDGASKSTTFIGGPVKPTTTTTPSSTYDTPSNEENNSQNTSVVSINITQSKSGDEFKHPPDSGTPSVVSLVSSGSSISDKIKASLRKRGLKFATDMVSDVSSVDSITLFGDKQNSTQSGPSLDSTPTQSKAAAIATLSLTDGGESIGSESNSRRPMIPQNPMHVKLKQQAASSISRPAAATPIDPLLYRARSRTVAHLHLATVAPPPTPPPLPPPPPLKGTKTSSPTMSVDRGYESLQSSGSSVHKQPDRSPTKRGLVSLTIDPGKTSSQTCISSSSDEGPSKRWRDNANGANGFIQTRTSFASIQDHSIEGAVETNKTITTTSTSTSTSSSSSSSLPPKMTKSTTIAAAKTSSSSRNQAPSKGLSAKHNLKSEEVATSERRESSPKFIEGLSPSGDVRRTVAAMVAAAAAAKASPPSIPPPPSATSLAAAKRHSGWPPVDTRKQTIAAREQEANLSSSGSECGPFQRHRYHYDNNNSSGKLASAAERRTPGSQGGRQKAPNSSHNRATGSHPTPSSAVPKLLLSSSSATSELPDVLPNRLSSSLALNSSTNIPPTSNSTFSCRALKVRVGREIDACRDHCGHNNNPASVDANDGDDDDDDRDVDFYYCYQDVSQPTGGANPLHDYVSHAYTGSSRDRSENRQCQDRQTHQRAPQQPPGKGVGTNCQLYCSQNTNIHQSQQRPRNHQHHQHRHHNHHQRHRRQLTRRDLAETPSELLMSEAIKQAHELRAELLESTYGLSPSSRYQNSNNNNNYHHHHHHHNHSKKQLTWSDQVSGR